VGNAIRAASNEGRVLYMSIGAAATDRLLPSHGVLPGQRVRATFKTVSCTGPAATLPALADDTSSS